MPPAHERSWIIRSAWGRNEETFSSHPEHFLGPLEVEGVGTGKDLKLWPGGGREWDWRETNTEHVPGIQPADVQELLDKGSKIVVLSRGCS